MMLSSLSLAQAGQPRIFVGTYTNGRDIKGIYTCAVDLKTGKLGPVELAAEAVNPSYLAISPSGKFLYSANEGAHGRVSAFRIEEGGSLTLLNDQDAGGSATCFVCVDATGRNVLAANYGSGSIVSFPIMPDGSLGQRTAFVQFSGSGPNKSRQTQPHAHSVYTDPSSHFVYCCDLGTDTIWTYKFDAKHGVIDADSVRTAKAPPGTGPRHLAFHPNGRFVYVNNEMGLNISAFERVASTGTLTPLQVIPTLLDGSTHAGTATTAEIAIHPTGKWLYVSNRGDDTIATYSIGPDGKLAWIESAKAIVAMPRGFAIDPTGQWLVAAGQKDNRIAVLAIDRKTGRLAPTDQTAPVGSPVCVIFAPPGR
ncbi:MAG: lactonase family protein [Capsulimonadaceae bacterium]|nr:lactonase family protein [Capsulimonadaceae bacterium]